MIDCVRSTFDWHNAGFLFLGIVIGAVGILGAISFTAAFQPRKQDQGEQPRIGSGGAHG